MAAPSDPAIFAAGECTRHPNRFAGGRARLELVQNAVDQAKAVAAAILGRPGALRRGALVLERPVRGQAADGRHLGRARPAGDPRAIRRTGRFSVFYFRDGRLLAINSVNRPGDHMTGRKLLAAGAAVSPAQAADEAST